MSWTLVYQKSWRALFWLALLVLALNIENGASAIGLDKLLTTRWPALIGLVGFIRSDTALHIALLIVGGGAFAWGNYIVRRMDEGVPGLRTLAGECERLAEVYSGEKLLIGTQGFVDRHLVRTTERLNRRLAIHNIAPAPLPEMSSVSSKLHVAQYLRGLEIFL